ncbi:hypothetical protein MYX78_00720 [Acidobacteria bacterium AH-259-G07]|nr:hypothetical protein [Acidobacteria bacterium AH-259-G07]
MRLRRYVIATFLIFLFESTSQAAPARWLHVRVEEAGKGEKVKVNIPLAVVETVLPLVKEQHLAKGRVRLQEKGFTVSDLREVWRTLRAEGDMTLVELESSDADVRVFIEGDYLRVESAETSEKKIHISVPTPVVDALLSGEGEEIDILAALQVLQQMGGQEIVSVQDDDTSVRVWIDESNETQ